jgi:hypothetical protein
MKNNQRRLQLVDCFRRDAVLQNEGPISDTPLPKRHGFDASIFCRGTTARMEYCDTFVCPSAIPVQEANDRIVVGKMGKSFREFRSRFGLFGSSELLQLSTSRCAIDV